MPAQPRYEVGTGFRRERSQLAARPSCVRVDQVDERLSVLGIVKIRFDYSNVQRAAFYVRRSVNPRD